MALSDSLYSHVQSESHVRQMQVVGEDPKKYIEKYSREFQHDFLQLLKTSHGEKSIDVNHFYQEYISHKEHIHMNATKWPSLTEFAKYLGREGICTVTEGEKGGLLVAWKDVSPEAVRRREAIRQQELQDAGNEQQEERLMKKMVERARLEAEAKATEAKASREKAAAAREAGGIPSEEPQADAKEMPKADGEKVKLNFSIKKSIISTTKGTLGTMKSKNDIFKRARLNDGEEKPKKKLKLWDEPNWILMQHSVEFWRLDSNWGR